MKVIHVIPKLWNGGAEKLVVELSNELSETEEVIICSFFDTQPGMFFIKNISKKVRLVTLSKKKGFDFFFLIRFGRFLFKEKPTVVNSHLSALNYCLPYILFFNRIKFFHTIHNIANLEESNKLFRKIRKLLFIRERLIPISISEVTFNSFKQTYGEKFFSALINNGVKKIEITEKITSVKNEILNFKKNEDTKVLLSVGRIAFQKNYDLLVDVFNDLLLENIVVVVIGADGSTNQENVKKLCNKTKGNVFFLGAKENISDYMACADAFCLSSRHEGMPITVIEAMSMGLPIISTPAGGVSNMVRSFENGLLSNDFSKQSYYETILTYLKLTESQIESFRENNKKEFKKKYSIELAKDNYLNLYKNIIING